MELLQESLKLMEMSVDGILTINDEGLIHSISVEGEHLFGYEHGELVGQDVTKLFEEKDRKDILQLITGQPGKEPWFRSSRVMTGLRQNGDLFMMQLTMAPIKFDGNSFMVLSIRDLNEIRRAEERFKLVVESSPTSIVMINKEGSIILVNNQTEKIFQYRREEIIGRKIEMLVPERYRKDHIGMRDGFFQSPSSRPVHSGHDLFGKRKDGSEFPVEIGLNPIPTGEGILVLGTIVDITKRKKDEEILLQSKRDLEQALSALQTKNEEVNGMTQQLWQAAKLASVGELAAGIAHELNNPLATISLRLESVLARTSSDDPRKRALDIINQEAKRMGDLVSNLLQFSRRGEEKISTVNLVEELNHAVELIKHQLRKHQIRLVKNTAPDTPTIYADRQKLRQVFLNLLSNASDAMPEGGELTIRAGQASLEDGTPAVKIEFQDTGPGIPAEHLDKVMDPFFTTKEEGKGTGLGLAICRRIIQEHRGLIEIASDTGKGTKVALLLPQKSSSNVKSLGIMEMPNQRPGPRRDERWTS